MEKETFWIRLSYYLQPSEMRHGQTDIIMLISCHRRMQAVLLKKRKERQPVFYSMIQLRSSAQTHTHTYKRGQDAHIHMLKSTEGSQRHDTNTLQSAESSCLCVRHHRESNWLSSLLSYLTSLCVCVCV